MAIDVTASETIDRSPDDVFAYMTEPRNDGQWLGGIREVFPPEGPITVGTQIERASMFMGRRVEYAMEIVRLEPGRLLEMRAVRAPYDMSVAYAVEPEGKGTRVSLRVRSPSGFGLRGRLLRPLMAWQVKRNLRSDLNRLHDRLTV